MPPFQGHNSENSHSSSREKPESFRRERLQDWTGFVTLASTSTDLLSGRLFSIMDVSGTIDAILGQKGREIFSVSADMTVYEAIELMAQKNVGALVVVENGTLIGLLSERDYTRKITLRGKRSRETQVREIMSTNLTTVTPREPVENCLRMMTEKRIRHLPVVEENTLRGIISIGDLVKWVIASQSAAIAHLESYISGGYSG